MDEEKFEITEKQRNALDNKISNIRDMLSDLRKEGKDPFTENLELKESISKLDVVYQDPKKENLERVKRHLNKIVQSLKKMGEETEEDLIKQYRKNEEEDE